jgi:hypothetical protein
MAVQTETATKSNIDEIDEIEVKLLLEGVLGYLAQGQRESLIFSLESSRYEAMKDEVSVFHKVR